MTAQIGDLVEKIGKTESSVRHRCNIGAMSPVIAAARANATKSKTTGAGETTIAADASKEETALAKAVKDS
jgi:COP9 signalosome complex subunit 5